MRKSMHQACIMNESLKAFLHKNTKKRPSYFAQVLEEKHSSCANTPNNVYEKIYAPNMHYE